MESSPAADPSPTGKDGLRHWLMERRSTVRLAFLLRTFSMGAAALLGLLWQRALIAALGTANYGTFVTFQGIAQLGGLGDFGLSGAIAVRVGQAIGRGDESYIARLLPAARLLAVLIAVSLAVLFIVLSPFLPHWFRLVETSSTGSLTLLFVTGGINLGLLLLGGYYNSLNLGYGTITWPILPFFVVGQMACAAQWLFAINGCPLWMQNLAFVGSTAVNLVLAWWMLNVAHPWYGQIFPLKADSAVWRELIGVSGWTYLFSISTTVYSVADRIFINTSFGPQEVPRYVQNFKLCDLATQLILTAAAVARPKITSWLASVDPEVRHKAMVESLRLNAFQSLLGIAAAIVYLGINNWFMQLWLGPSFVAPLWWQYAFALMLACGSAGDAWTQLASVCGSNGLKAAGIALGGTALLKVGLSFLSIASGSILGLALATVLAQVVLTASLGTYATSYMKAPKTFVLRSCLVPIAAVSAAFGLRYVCAPSTGAGLFLLILGDMILLLASAWAVGVTPGLIAREWQVLRGMMR